MKILILSALAILLGTGITAPSQAAETARASALVSVDDQGRLLVNTPQNKACRVHLPKGLKVHRIQDIQDMHEWRVEYDSKKGDLLVRPISGAPATVILIVTENDQAGANLYRMRLEAQRGVRARKIKNMSFPEGWHDAYEKGNPTVYAARDGATYRVEFVGQQATLILFPEDTRMQGIESEDKVNPKAAWDDWKVLYVEDKNFLILKPYKKTVAPTQMRVHFKDGRDIFMELVPSANGQSPEVVCVKVPVLTITQENHHSWMRSVLDQKPGEATIAVLTKDVVQGDKVVAPKGSRIRGTVAKDGSASTFTDLMLPDGNPIAIEPFTIKGLLKEGE